MPKILEMRRIDGDLWVKIDDPSFGEHGPVQLLSEQEIEQMRITTLREAAQLVTNAADKLASEIYGGR